LRRFSTVPSANSPNAASVGANKVNGPSLCNVLVKLAASAAAKRVSKIPAFEACPAKLVLCLEQLPAIAGWIAAEKINIVIAMKILIIYDSYFFRNASKVTWKHTNLLKMCLVVATQAD
jgi:hypothetical protein